MPTGTLLSANITPDKETGIGAWTKQHFVTHFKAYDLATYSPPVLSKEDLMTVKPWTMFAGMGTTYLEAIYAYLKTLAPVKNLVTL